METFVHHQEHPVDLAMAGGRPEAGPIRMELTKANLWREFHSEGNEMIITKSGRNLFPKLKVRLYGLQPEEHYTVVLEMRLAAPRRFKFSNNHWVDAGEADPQFDEHRTYVQSVVPDKHATWCDVDLKNAKISNSTVDGRGNIVLTSMHKYIPYLHVIRGADMQGHHLVPSSLPVTTAFFPETEFIAVTAYQNDAITRKKIENNPFAKGFRETGKAKCRRNQRQSAACVLQGAKEALEMMQEARRDSAASPMSSACSTSSACSASSDSEAFAFRGLPTPPASRTPTPPLRPCLPCAVPPTRGFGIDDILYGDRYSTRRAFHETIAPAAPLPVHPLYQFMYAPMPYWVPYPGLYAPSIPTMAPIAPLPLTMDAAEAYHSYPNMLKQE